MAFDRREFVALLGGAVAWPGAAGAQQAMPVIGFLNGQSASDRGYLLDAFRRGLGEAGHVEGRSVTIDYRWAENQPDRLRGLAADLVRRKVTVIAATGGNNSVLAAKAETTTIPLVFTSGDDPVKAGLVGSLNRPEANVTGVSWFSASLIAKRIEVFHELVPGAANIGLLVNPRNREALRQPTDAQDAGRALGLTIDVLQASDVAEIDAAFASLKQRNITALVVAADPFLNGQADRMIAHAARLGVPVMYISRPNVEVGGLMSYGNDFPDAYRRAGVYVGRIVNGAKPADMPIDQASKFELVINRRTARALGLEIPSKLLFTADEVIE